MIFVWSGLGFSTFLIAFAFASIGAGLLQPAIANALPDAPAYAGFAFGLLAAAPSNWYLGLWFNKQTGRELFDPKTRDSALTRGAHTFFYIAMQYYSALMLAVAVVALFVPGPKIHHLPIPESGPATQQ